METIMGTVVDVDIKPNGNGQDWAIAKLATATGEREILVFPKCWMLFGDKLVKGSLAQIDATVHGGRVFAQEIVWA